MNLFTLSLQLNKFPINKAQQFLMEIQQISSNDYPEYLEGRKQEIVAFHLRKNRFYRDFFKNKKMESWEEVPVMRKSDLQRPLEERLSDGYQKNNCLVGKTSGSSGHPFIFSKDKFCHALTWAVFADRYADYGIDINKSLQARFYGIPLDSKGYFKERLKDWIGKRYRFPVFNLNEKALLSIFLKFKKTPFEYINGYTSSIVLFAKYLRSRDITLKSLCPSLKLCIVTSEMLFEEDRTLLETWFGVPVVNEYGASEVGLIAFQNAQKQLLLNFEDLYVEILDHHGKPVPPGEEGNIVITSLFNKSHPIIRYDIGDRGILDPNGSVKFPVLKKLTGRTNDVALLPSGKVVPGLTFYYVTKTLIENDSEVKEFIVQQTATDTFKFIYVGKTLSEVKISQIKKAVEQYLEKGLILKFEKFPLLDRSNRGKLKQFEKLF